MHKLDNSIFEKKISKNSITTSPFAISKKAKFSLPQSTMELKSRNPQKACFRHLLNGYVNFQPAPLHRRSIGVESW